MKRLKAIWDTLLPERSHRNGELWGYWIAHAESLRCVLILSLLANLCLGIVLPLVARKPPVVIRVDQVGNAVAIRNLRNTSTTGSTSGGRRASGHGEKEQCNGSEGAFIHGLRRRKPRPTGSSIGFTGPHYCCTPALAETATAGAKVALAP